MGFTPSPDSEFLEPDNNPLLLLESDPAGACQLLDRLLLDMDHLVSWCEYQLDRREEVPDGFPDTGDRHFDEETFRAIREDGAFAAWLGGAVRREDVEMLLRSPERLLELHEQIMGVGPTATATEPVATLGTIPRSVAENRYAAGGMEVQAGTAGHRALLATLGVLQKCGEEARNFAIQRLKELVAEISHRFWAPRAWLFLKDGDVLRAVVRRKTGRTDATIPLNEKSIVTRVARTGETYYTNDAPNDPYIRRSVPSTMSAMAAPLKTIDGELVGVLCLETHQPNAFSAGLLANLSETVVELIPHVLVLKALERTDGRWCPWHPRVHKWDLARILRLICHAIVDALEGDVSDAIECAVWSADRTHDELYVYGTSGHGTEYIKDETLPFASFTGSVAECPVGTVGRVRPCEDQHSTLQVPTSTGWETREGFPFVMQYKRSFMGLTEAMAVPIHRPDSAGDAGEARYVLGIYAYGDQAVPALPSREELVRMAEILGHLFSAYEEQRERLAVAYFAEALAEWQAGWDFSPIMRELGVFLHLKEVRIYAEVGRSGELVAIDNDGLHRRPLTHDDGSWKYLTDLLAHPGVPVRVNGAESRCPDVLSNVLTRDASGWLPWDDPERRRFLDVGIEGLGVIRLVRLQGSKPFAPDDERIFHRLAMLCGQVLRNWDTVTRRTSLNRPPSRTRDTTAPKRVGSDRSS